MADSADEGWGDPAPADSSPEAPDLVGTVAAGRYRVVARIGRGTTRDVYEAEHVDLHTRVALRVLRAEHAESEAAARFLREGKTLGLFRHVNIVELLEVGRLDDGSLFLATELVRGPSLRELIDRGIMDQKRALLIMRQVLEALAAAHSVGVIHRDIKPENIMLAEPGRADGSDLVKMLDFGIAKLFSDTATTLGEGKLTKVGMNVFGSPRYIPPECVVGGEIDQRADLYMAGAVLFEMLTGKPPFHDDDASALMRLHAYAPVITLQQRAPDRRFTPQIEFLVAEALQKKPGDRFRSATEMIGALDAAVHSLEVAEAEAAAALPPPPAHDNSFMMLAQDYRPPPTPSPQVALPEVVPVMDRKVRPPGIQIRVRNFFRRHWPKVRDPIQRKWPKLRELTRAHKMIALAAGGTLLIVMIISIAVCSGGGKDKSKAVAQPTHEKAGKSDDKAPDLAARAHELLTAGKPKQAAELVETELAGGGEASDGEAYLVLGHARMAMGRKLDALSAYERAIKLQPKLASDEEMRTHAVKLLDTRSDIAAALVALELLAGTVKPPARDVIVAAASTGKHPEVRHRAFAIAEREGIADRVDRFESWSLDLSQAASCEDRRAAVAKLGALGDRRAIPALKRVKVHKCVAKDVAEAIAKIESTAPDEPK